MIDLDTAPWDTDDEDERLTTTPEHRVRLLLEDAAESAMGDGELLTLARETLGRKFTRDDISNAGEAGTVLYDIAELWLPSQTGASFAWLADVAVKVVAGATLTDHQAAGVLNCYYQELVRSAPRPQRETPVPDDDDTSYDAWLIFQTALVPKGYYTVGHDDRVRRTFNVGVWKPDARREGHTLRWVGMLKGSAHSVDYETIAFQRDTGEVVKVTGCSATDIDLTWLRALLGDEKAREDAQLAYALASNCCARCGRRLTVPASIAKGLGPECSGKV